MLLFYPVLSVPVGTVFVSLGCGGCLGEVVDPSCECGCDGER